MTDKRVFEGEQFLNQENGTYLIIRNRDGEEMAIRAKGLDPELSYRVTVEVLEGVEIPKEWDRGSTKNCTWDLELNLEKRERE